MQIAKVINKILTAIRMKGIDIKIDHIETYSSNLLRYITAHKVYVKEKGKYVLQESFYNKTKLAQYLVEQYKRIGSDAGWKN